MADYITIYPDNKAKSDQIWSEICSGTIISKLDKEIITFEKELKDLDTNPAIETNYELQTRENDVEFKLATLNSFKNAVIELEKSVENGDEKEIKERVESIEYQVQGNYEGPSLSEPSEPIYSFFVELFKQILRIDIFENFGSLTKAPTELWVKLFQNISKDAISKAVEEAGGNWDDKDDQKYYIWALEAIKEIVKYCKDKNMEIIVRDEYEDAATENKNQKRINEIWEKIKNKGCLTK